MTFLTLEIFTLSGKIPLVKDKLYMKHRCSPINCLAIFSIFVGMLFVLLALLSSRPAIIFRILFLVQRDVRDNFSLFNDEACFIRNWIVGALEQKNC